HNGSSLCLCFIFPLIALDSSNHTKTCSPMPKAQLYSTAFICTQMLIFFFCLDLSTVPSAVGDLILTCLKFYCTYSSIQMTCGRQIFFVFFLIPSSKTLMSHLIL
ncbi:expressed protein, partial [Phakopsora pachyrhizi]